MSHAHGCTRGGAFSGAKELEQNPFFCILTVKATKASAGREDFPGHQRPLLLAEGTALESHLPGAIAISISIAIPWLGIASSPRFPVTFSSSATLRPRSNSPEAPGLSPRQPLPVPTPSSVNRMQTAPAGLEPTLLPDSEPVPDLSFPTWDWSHELMQ